MGDRRRPWAPGRPGRCSPTPPPRPTRPAPLSLYRTQLDDDLRYADKRSSQRIAATLTTMRRLYAAAGSTASLDDEVRAIRKTYRHRPALIAELDRAALPR